MSPENTHKLTYKEVLTLDVIYTLVQGFCFLNTIHPIVLVRMSPETTHKLMGFYMEVVLLGVIL